MGDYYQCSSQAGDGKREAQVGKNEKIPGEENGENQKRWLMEVGEDADGDAPEDTGQCHSRVRGNPVKKWMYFTLDPRVREDDRIAGCGDYPNQEPDSYGKRRGEMALVGVDVEVPKCGDHPAVPGGERGEGGECQRAPGEKIYEGKGAVEKEKKNGEECDARIVKQFFCKRPDAPKEEGKSQGAWDIEGPVEA